MVTWTHGNKTTRAMKYLRLEALLCVCLLVTTMTFLERLLQGPWKIYDIMRLSARSWGVWWGSANTVTHIVAPIC